VSQSCIWCGASDNRAPPEHIVPECLGCPPGAIFTDGEVCGDCNNRLSRLDNVLCDGFDLLRLAFRQPGKRRRPPAIAGRPNARTTNRDGEHRFEINFGPDDQITRSGRRLKAPINDLASIQGDVAQDGDIVRATYRAHMFYQRDFTRGIYKIALEAIALFLGCDAARSTELDWVRTAVLNPEADPPRCLIDLNSGTFETRTFSHQLFSPYKPNDGSPGFAVAIRLFNVEFTADCTPSQSLLGFMLGLREFAPAAHKWRVLPWDRDPSIRLRPNER
jgi:hypothetical protein